MRTKFEFYQTQAVKKEMHIQEPTFKPAINRPKTTKNSKIDDDSVKQPRYQQIMEKGNQYKEKRALAAEISQFQKNQDKELTFHPTINPKSARNRTTGKPIWQKLHEQAENYFNSKIDQEHDIMELTKDPDQFTFHPQIMGDKRSGTFMEPFYKK